jgi:hypothetical protein
VAREGVAQILEADTRKPGTSGDLGRDHANGLRVERREDFFVTARSRSADAGNWLSQLGLG